MLIFFIMAQN